MTMSHDRVRFRLPSKYFQRHVSRQGNGMTRADCARVLQDALGMSPAECQALFEAFPDGPRFQCRPSQFARFIVLRHDAMRRAPTNGVNGINDLEPELVVPAQVDGFEALALCTGTSRDQVRALVHALGLTKREVENRLSEAGRPPYDVDVSANRNTHRAVEVTS